jgi:hypothetical protein
VNKKNESKNSVKSSVSMKHDSGGLVRESLSFSDKLRV